MAISPSNHIACYEEVEHEEAGIDDDPGTLQPDSPDSPESSAQVHPAESNYNGSGNYSSIVESDTSSHELKTLNMAPTIGINLDDVLRRIRALTVV